MLDTGAKKKGILSIVTMSVLIVVMGVIVSCGYKAGEGSGDSGNGGAGNGSAADGELRGEDEQNTGYSGESASEENDAGGGGLVNTEASENFDYNHVYNDIIRCYQGDLYLAKEDGIYYLKGGQGEGELLYGNPYEAHRGKRKIRQRFTGWIWKLTKWWTRWRNLTWNIRIILLPMSRSMKETCM